MPSTCLRRLSDTRVPSRTEGYATLQAKISENIICDCPSRGPVTRPASCCNLKKKEFVITMSAENSRTYSTDDDGESNYGAMESVPNSEAEDGASDGAGMDSDKCRHGKLSLNNELETDNDSVDSNDSSSHTPAAQKSKRQRRLSMSPPCKSPSPLPPEQELEPFRYDSLSNSTPRRRTGFRRPRIMWANAASWNTNQNTEAHIYQEIARIMAVSMSDVKVEVTPKHNEKAISHFRLKTVSTRRNISILSIGIQFLSSSSC